MKSKLSKLSKLSKFQFNQLLYKLEILYYRCYKRKILVIGDSHVEVFKNVLLRRLSNKYFFCVNSVGGATASGLENPNSKTQSMNEFRRALSLVPAPEYIIINLGEVDTGFVIWYRKQKYDSKIEDLINSAVCNYMELIELSQSIAPVICISAPLPTINDDCSPKGKVANLRLAVQSTQYERTQLTLLFNNKVNQLCKKKGVTYLNLDSRSLSPDGLVNKKLLNKDALDHHYNPTEYAKMIKDELKNTVIFKDG